MTEARLLYVRLPGYIPIPVWAVNGSEALSIALGIIETDGKAYESRRPWRAARKARARKEEHSQVVSRKGRRRTRH